MDLTFLVWQVREKEIRSQAELARAKAIADHARAQQEREEEVERKTRQARRDHVEITSRSREIT